MILKADKSNWKVDDIINLLKKPDYILTASTFVHELAHNRTDITLPDNVENLYFSNDDLKASIQEKYKKCKNTMKTMFVEAMAVSYGRLTYKVNDDTSIVVIEKNIADTEYAVFTATGCPVYATLFENLSILLGKEYFEIWMQNEKRDSLSWIKFFEDNEQVNLHFVEMQLIIDEKYGEGTFEALFNSMCDILIAYQEYTIPINDIEFVFYQYSVEQREPIEKIFYDGVNKLSNNEIEYSITDLINEIEKFVAQTDEQEEIKIKLIERLNLMKNINIGEIQASSESAKQFQETMLDCLIHDLENELKNENISQEEIIALFNTYRNYLTKELIVIEGNDSAYDEKINAILELFHNSFVKHNIEIAGYTFQDNNYETNMVVLKYLYEHNVEGEINIQTHDIHSASSMQQIGIDMIQKLNDPKSDEYAKIYWMVCYDIFKETGTERKYDDFDNLIIPAELQGKIEERQRQTIEAYIAYIKNIGLEETIEMLVIQNGNDYSNYYVYNGEIFGIEFFDTEQFINMSPYLKIAFMNFLINHLQGVKNVGELKSLDEVTPWYQISGEYEQFFFYHFYSEIRENYFSEYVKQYWSLITDENGYIMEENKTGLEAIQQYLDYCNSTQYFWWKTFSWESYEEEEVILNQEQEQRDMVLRQLKQRNIEIAGYTFESGEITQEDRDMLTLIVELDWYLERDSEATIDLIETGIKDLSIVWLYTNGEYEFSLICDGKLHRDISWLEGSQKHEQLKDFLTSNVTARNVNLMILICRDIIGTEEIIKEEYETLRGELYKMFEKKYKGCDEKDFLAFLMSGIEPTQVQEEQTELSL